MPISIADTGVGGRGHLLLLSQIQIKTHAATTTIQMNKCTRIKLDFNSIKSSFNSREKYGALQVLIDKRSVKIPTLNLIQKCEHEKFSPELGLLQSKCKSESKKIRLRAGPVQARFYLRNYGSSWLVLGALER